MILTFRFVYLLFNMVQTRGFCKTINNFLNFNKNYNKCLVYSSTVAPKCNLKLFSFCYTKKHVFFKIPKTFLALSILSWLGFTGDDETKESELIMTLKRAVLSTNREQYDKAEQFLHIALRLAQQQQNTQGVLYCYDLMANLAMNRLELDKAEVLFVSVMQMLLSQGVKEDDIKVRFCDDLLKLCFYKTLDRKNGKLHL